MQQDTELTKDLEAAGLKVRYDEHVKRIISNRSVLARILQGTVEEFSDYSIEEIIHWIDPDIQISHMQNTRITGDNTEDKVPGAGAAYYDVRFKVCIPSGNEIPLKLLINIEAQKDFYKKYHIVTRGVFYAARMISSQLGTEFVDSDYDNIKKVYSIWICMNAPGRIGNSMTEYSIRKRDIIGNMPERKSNYDKLSVVILCLNDNVESVEGGVHDFLNVLLSEKFSIIEKKEKLEKNFGMQMQKEMEADEMCNLSEGIWERGISNGITQGQDRVNRLNQYLIRDGRMNDMIKAVTDAVFQKQLFLEYGISEMICKEKLH